ncbi:MAG TPA: hypothetical protein VFO38_01620 [Candidatus Saccharimonadales bacterium]|nr:hypothetical protein [Candidatus Saccharimonadales bacterium]
MFAWILGCLFGVLTIAAVGVAYWLNQDSGSRVFWMIAVAVIGAMPTVAWGPSAYYVSYYNERLITCTVSDKDNLKYIYTKDCGTLANLADSWRGKRDTTAVWSAIEKGKAYRFRVVGANVPNGAIWRNLPNVLSVEVT